MRGSRKFCQRGYKFESFFLVDKGTEDINITINGSSLCMRATKTLRRLCVWTGLPEHLLLDITPGRRQSKTLLTIDGSGSKIVSNSVFDCHFSPVGRQMAIENSISNDFYPRSSIVLTFFDCRLPGVDIAIIYCINSEYVAFLRLINA